MMDINNNDYPFIDINELKPYKNNARLHPQDQVDKICNSIKEFGFIAPVIIDENNTILVGHGRTLGAKQAGLTAVPYRRITNLTEEQKRAYILADNKLSDIAEWDEELLKTELESITLDMTAFGFDEFEIKFDEEEIKEDTPPEPPEEPKACLGDIYLLGEHRLMCGDSTDINAVNKLMDGEKSDLIHTDPPYGVDMGRTLVSGEDNSILNDDLDEDALKQLLHDAISNCVMVSKKDAAIYCWIGFRAYAIAEDIIKQFYKVNNCIVWVKPSIGLGGNGYRYRHELCIFSGAIEDRSLSDVWEFDRDKSVLHPTMKPLELCAHALRNSSKPGDIVLDLFGGSGSTLIACEQMGRKCRMMELDPRYVDVIVSRWENFTGKTAELIKEGD